MDGALTRAVEAGEWVLLDSANLCNPTVLDRLNPMLEPGGQLYLNECGTVNGQPRVIQPHPGFRLFLALDPRCCLNCLSLIQFTKYCCMTALLHVISDCCYAMPCQYPSLIRLRVSVYHMYEYSPLLHDIVFFPTFVTCNLHVPCTLACFVCCMLQVGACTLEVLQRLCTQTL